LQQKGSSTQVRSSAPASTREARARNGKLKETGLEATHH
jgi:hypothetical protein